MFSLREEIFVLTERHAKNYSSLELSRSSIVNPKVEVWIHLHIILHLQIIFSSFVTKHFLDTWKMSERDHGGEDLVGQETIKSSTLSTEPSQKRQREQSQSEAISSPLLDLLREVIAKLFHRH